MTILYAIEAKKLIFELKWNEHQTPTWSSIVRVLEIAQMPHYTNGRLAVPVAGKVLSRAYADLFHGLATPEERSEAVVTLLCLFEVMSEKEFEELLTYIHADNGEGE